MFMHGHYMHAWRLKRSEELELWMVASHHVGAKNPDHPQEQQGPLTTEPTSRIGRGIFINVSTLQDKENLEKISFKEGIRR